MEVERKSLKYNGFRMGVMVKREETDEAIEAVDALLATVGLEHGHRGSLGGTWKGGERIKKVSEAEVKKGVRRKAQASGGAEMAVRVPGWERWGWMRAGFSRRSGGVSSAYGGKSLNLGWKEEDEKENVAENRRRFLEEIGGARRGGGVVPLVTLRQFHSGMIRVVREGDRALEEARGGAALEAGRRAALRGDGAMTDVAGVLLGVQVADCVPVLVADVKKRVVAAFHAGWRGTLGRIVERGVGTMRLEYGSRPEDMVAAVGPSIGPCCYSVGEEVRHEFESQFAYAPELFTEVYDSDPVRDKYPLLFLTARAPGHSNIGPQIHLDLWEANRRQLMDAGVPEKKIVVLGECTSCARDQKGERMYFSHRGESGFAGRMMGVIGMEERE